MTDPTGAVIPDADVSATDVATGVGTKTKTNSDGLYIFPRLSPGVYTLVVQKQGHKKQEFQEVKVVIGQDTTIDAALQAGQLTEVITVTATGEELIQKEQAQVSSTFEARKVAELPSNIAGGGIDTLALLSPGVIPGVGNVNGNGTTFSVNGNRARSNNFTIDGGDNNDLSIGGPNYFVDNQDIVAEFQVITNNFSAEYGRNQGAIVNIVTKSGTNSFHGTAYEYHRNRNFLDSLTNIERRGGRLSGPSPRIYNVFGGTVGGPVLKDRLFFFGSFQELKDRQSALSQGTTPAIAPEDLPKLEALPGYSSNPALQALRNLSAFAVPNAGGGTLTFRNEANFSTNETVTIGGVPFHVLYPSRIFPQNNNAPEFSARGDWRINNSNSVWFRQLYQRADNINGVTSTASAGNMGDLPVNSKISSASWTTQLSNTAVNEFKFIFNRLSVIFGGGCEGTFATCIPDPIANMGQTLPNIALTGIRSSLTNRSLQTIGPATNLPQGRVVTVYQFQDNFSKTIGSHQLKFGADIRKLTNSVPFLPNVNGAFTFNTIGSTSAANGLLQNRPQRAIVAAGQVLIDYGETDQFYYLQDNWRVSDSLTLNLGIRYEYTGQPINTLHQISLDRESDTATALWKQSLPIEARTLAKLPADKNNWAPRFGFAWRPNFGGGIGKRLFGEQDKTVISGGYSIAYDPVFYNIMLNISTSSPVVFNSTTLNAATGTVSFPVPGLSGQAVQDFATSSGLIARNLFDPKFFNQTIVSPNFHSPYSQQWSIRIQREISRNNVLEVRYVGTHGVSLFATHNANPRFDRLKNGFTAGGVAFPGFPDLVPSGLTPQVAGQGGCVDDPATPAAILNEANTCAGRILPQALVRIRDNTAQSIYHALQSRYDGRLANQLNFGMSYTWSKALDNASEVFAFNDAVGSANPFDHSRLERSYSQFDRRHAFAANFIWDVPLYKEQKGLLGKLAGGWQLNGTYLLAAGQRYTPFSSWGTSFLGTGYSDVTWDATFVGIDTNRPFFGNPKAPRQTVGISQVDANMVFNTATFPVPVRDPNGFYDLAALNNRQVVQVSKDQVRYIVNGPGAARLFGKPYGDVPRNYETGPLLNNINLGIYKNFKLRESLTLRVSMDAFNALNHPNPAAGFIASGATPNATVENAGVTFNRYDESEYARRAIQLGVKIIF